MKMRDEDYTRLKAAIQEGLGSHDLKVVHDRYKKAALVDKQFHWDVFWYCADRADTTLVHDLYGYLKDAHIGTALKKIMDELLA